METIITYFEDMPSIHRTILLVGGLSFFFLIEQWRPLFALSYDRTRHTLVNIFFTLTTVLVNLGLAFVLLKTSVWVTEENIGLLHWFEIGIGLKILLGVALMDFMAAWVVHYIEHKVRWMWRFHMIHHTDKHVDTTTGNRHHPGESVIRFFFTWAAIILVGAPVWLVFLYQSLSLVLTQFNHANIQMPSWLDWSLNLIICTPDMHRVHHHYRQPYSDTNYGNIFSWWDRIFGTFRRVDNRKLIYGLDTHFESSDAASVNRLLKLPFEKYRPQINYQQPEEL